MTSCYGMRLRGRHVAFYRLSGEYAFADNSVSAPVAIDHLGHAKINPDRQQRYGLIFA